MISTFDNALSSVREMSRDEFAAATRKAFPDLYRWTHLNSVEAPEGYWSDAPVAGMSEQEIISCLTGELENDVALHAQIVLSDHGIPRYHVSKAMFEAMQRTEVPEAMPIEQFKTPFPAVRFVFEKGSMPFSDGTELVTLDVSLVEKGYSFTIPEPVINGLLKHNIPVYRADEFRGKTYDSAALHIRAITRHQVRDEYNYYTWVRGYGDTIQVVGDLFSREMFKNSLLSPDNARRMEGLVTDKAHMMENLISFYVNAVLLITGRPEYLEGGEVVKAPRWKWSTGPKEYRTPRFLGKKFAYTKGSTGDRPRVGYKLPPGWRCGHWKNIPYGPNHSLRRYDWIQPYAYGYVEESKAPASA